MATPTTEPTEVTAGDFVTWQISLPDYPASAGWVLSYAFVKTGTQITVTASASGDDHLVAVAAATSAGWTAGTYQWQARVTKTTEVYTVRKGSLTIQPNFAAASSGYDGRSHARKVLDALNAWIENHDPAVQDYQIAGRSMRYIPMGDLLKLRSDYERRVAAEAATQRAAAGLPSRSKINVRL